MAIIASWLGLREIGSSRFQPDREGAALSRGGLDRDFSAQALNDFFGDG